MTPGNAGDGSVAETLLADVIARPKEPGEKKTEIYGDASYGTGEIIKKVEAAGAEAMVKVQAPVNTNGHFTKDAFSINLKRDTVRCPAGQLVQIRRRQDGSGTASFAAFCGTCELRSGCTKSATGRSIGIHPQEEVLGRERKKQRTERWKNRYRATRPKVERKLAHLMSRRHGGRRARVRGRARVAADFALLGAAVNLRRIASLGVRVAS